MNVEVNAPSPECTAVTSQPPDCTVTPLLTAVQDCPELVPLLLQHQANCYIRNDQGETALHIACANSQFDVIRALVEAGACVNVKTSPPGAENLVKKSTTPLNLCMKNWTANTESAPHRQIIIYLLDRGANPNVRLPTSMTALSMAVQHGDLALTEALLKHGANVRQHGALGVTPLTQALYQNATEMIRLVASYSNFDVCNTDKKLRKRSTMLRVAVQNGNLHLIKILLEGGYDWRQWDSSWLLTRTYTATRASHDPLIPVYIRSVTQGPHACGMPPRSLMRLCVPVIRACISYNHASAIDSINTIPKMLKDFVLLKEIGDVLPLEDGYHTDALSQANDSDQHV